MADEKRFLIQAPSGDISGGPEQAFGELLRQLRVERGVSQAALAGRAGMDRSYVNRIEAGERGAPALAATEALADALDLSDTEADRLFAAAGLLPRSLRALGPADPTILLLAQGLTDIALTEEARAALRATVETIVRHWANTSRSGSPRPGSLPSNPGNTSTPTRPPGPSSVQEQES